jgi:KDO2-lipid IV(A) lauroyltransferase
MRRSTLGQSLVAGLVAAAGWLACRLPGESLERICDLLGAAHYLLNPRRRELVRANLRRVCEALAADGRAAPRVAAAAGDPGALERLVRAAFRHHGRYLSEVLRTPIMDAAWLEGRFLIETPEVVERAYARVAAGEPMIVIGLHFGAVEVSAVYSAERTRAEVVGPMEEIANPALQAWFVRQRESLGLRVIAPPEAAAAELRRVLREGGIAAIVGDRDITGGGRLTAVFGRPAPLPVGPALLALESAAPAYVVGARRTGWGHYAARLVALESPGSGSLRERAEGFLAQEVRAFESIVADAPEQWWAVMFPIWPDLIPQPAPGREAAA